MVGFRTLALRTGRQVGVFLARIKLRVPFGMRTLIGMSLIVGGVFGFLPVLGFWMIPLGFLVIGLDVTAVQKRCKAWRARRAVQRRRRSRDFW
jgi:hypothetical protein